MRHCGPAVLKLLINEDTFLNMHNDPMWYIKRKGYATQAISLVKHRLY